jgi:TRAP-type mannitol/chloroaromatic compound transport system permease large subunit
MQEIGFLYVVIPMLKNLTMDAFKKSSNATITVLFLVTFLIFGAISMHCCFKDLPKSTLIQTFYYDLDDGESGVTCFTINSDSTVSVEYILDNITQSANHLNHEEYTQLMKKVYPHY